MTWNWKDLDHIKLHLGLLGYFLLITAIFIGIMLNGHDPNSSTLSDLGSTDNKEINFPILDQINGADDVNAPGVFNVTLMLAFFLMVGIFSAIQNKLNLKNNKAMDVVVFTGVVIVVSMGLIGVFNIGAYPLAHMFVVMAFIVAVIVQLMAWIVVLYGLKRRTKFKNRLQFDLYIVYFILIVWLIGITGIMLTSGMPVLILIVAWFEKISFFLYATYLASVVWRLLLQE